MIIFSNPDKDSFQENWDDINGKKRSMANFPHSFRACFLSPPGRGKSNLTKNILIAQKSEFQRILLYSNSEMSREYENIEIEFFENTPTEQDLLIDLDENGQPPKQIVIIEDVDLEHLSKVNENNLLKLLKHYSSHFNTSVIINVQDLIQIPSTMRRCCNIFGIWKMSNMTLKILGDRFNIENKTLWNMAERELNEWHDFLIIDLTKKSPYKYRKNLYQLLDENDYNGKNDEWINIENNPKKKILNFPIFNKKPM